MTTLKDITEVTTTIDEKTEILTSVLRTMITRNQSYETHKAVLLMLCNDVESLMKKRKELEKRI